MIGSREMRPYSAQRHRKETGLVMALGEAGRVIGGGIPPDLLPFIAAAPAADRKSSMAMAANDQTWSVYGALPQWM